MKRDGFTLIEIVVAVGIMAVLVGVITVVALPRLSQSRAARTVADYHTIHEAVTSFRQDVGFYPRALSSLTAPITAASMNSCGTAIGTGRVNRWRGPYLDRIVEPTGLPTGTGTFADTMIRLPATAATPTEYGSLLLVVPQADSVDVLVIEERVDPTVNFGTGSVVYFFNAVVFVIPLAGC